MLRSTIRYRYGSGFMSVKAKGRGQDWRGPLQYYKLLKADHAFHEKT